MTFYEVPKLATYTLEKYRNIKTDKIESTNISGSQQTLTGSFFGTNITGSQLSLSGNLYVTGTVSGSIVANTASKKGTLSLAAASGSTPHGLAGTPNQVFLTASGSANGGTTANWYLGGLFWFPSGSTGIWIIQTGSGIVNVNWKAEI